MAHGTSDCGASDCMMARHMAGYGAHSGALQTTRSVGGHRRTAECGCESE